MAELADAPDLGSGVFDVGVQVPSPAPSENTIEIWTLKFRLNGVFIIKPSIYAAFQGRIFFLTAGLKTEKLEFYNPRIKKQTFSNPLVYLHMSYKPTFFKAYSSSFCSGVLYCSFLCGRLVL